VAWATPSRERRVLKAGHSSIAVTLPKPWAAAMNLRPGDLIVFDQNDDGTLYLKPAPVPGTVTAGAPFQVQAHAFESPGVLERLIEGAYRVGHDAIEIRTEVPLTAERVEELHATARSLIGVSIVAQEPNRILLQNFIDPSKYGLPQLVQRMKMILVALLEESQELLDRRSRSRRLTNLTEEADKVLALLVRQLFLASRDWSLARRIGSPDPRQLLEWRVVVHALEELAGLLGECATELNREPVRRAEPTGELKEVLEELKTGLKLVMETLMRPSVEGACDGYAESQRVVASAHVATRHLRRPGQRAAVGWASSSLDRAAGCLALLSEIALDRSVAQGTEPAITLAP